MSIKSKKTAYADSVIYKSEPTSAGTWSEWSDYELNSEPWDYPKSGEFTDPQQVEMPSSLQPAKWKRFQNLKNVVTPIVFEPTSDYPDLITNNSHLLHSEFMRCFVSTLINVQYCGRNGLQIENPSNNFSWNFTDECWQGWYHVYSMNKAGKGASHRPTFNPKGKYIVRLFSMGLWRRIVVDDLIPVDKRGRPLLPRTGNNDELWSMLLAKAMLKIAALSWTPGREIVNCSLVTSLTGWIDLSLNVAHLSPRDQWEFITKYAKHFEWSQEDKREIVAISEDLRKGKEKEKRKSTTNIKNLRVPEEPHPTLLFLSLEDTRNVDAEEIPGITPCWNHQIYVELSRDIPLDPAQVKPPLAKWKLHRWLDWATRRGLIDTSEYFLPIRHLLIVSPLRQCNADTYTYNECEEEEDSQGDSSETTVASKVQDSEKMRSNATARSSKDHLKASTVPDISLWGDFNKMSLYLREIHLFYRPQFFKHFIEVSDSAQIISGNDAKKGKPDSTTKDSKKTGKSVSPESSTQPKSYEYQDKVLQSRNEPLYLLVDSTENKFFIINFSTMILPQKDPSRILQPRRNSSLIVERHNWFNKTMENALLAEIKGSGTMSSVFQLESGRHLLRLFISTDSSYHVNILSDTPFQVGNRAKMHDFMTTESESINAIVQKISISVKKAFESFGTASHASDLRIYYQSYMPDLTQSAENPKKKILKSIHRDFSEEFAKLLEIRFNAVELPSVQRALRIFFLDPSIGRSKKQHYFQDNESWNNADGAEWDENRSAMILQSFFRMILVKRYRDIHDTGDGQHNRVKDALMRVIELFNYDEHESAGEILLRALVKRDSIYENLYACVNDFKHVIQIQELKGRSPNVTSDDQWIPILRVEVNAPKWQTILAALDLFTNLPNYTLRVFANDTRLEMSRVANNVAPTTYRYRNAGYTIFAYGWSDFQKTRDFEWSLHLTTMKGDPMFHWLKSAGLVAPKNDIAPLMIQDISNNYIPNARNCLLKLIVRVKNSCQLTLRLKTSYERVTTKLRVTSETGACLAEVEGGAVVIMPVVYLQHVDSNDKEVISRLSEEKASSRRSKRSLSGRSGGSQSHRSGNVSKRASNEDNQDVETSTRYIIEAFVRQDSWPLTASEWAVVLEAKSKALLNNTRLGRSSTLGKMSKDRPRSKQLSRKSLEHRETLEQPYWTLRIVTDGEKKLDVLQDRSKEDKIIELKRLWKTDEAERFQRGSELRERFLQDNRLASSPPPSIIDIPGSIIDQSGQTTENFGELDEETSEPRTLEPPVDLRNHLPKLDLSIYMEKDDEEEQSWVKSEYDEETLRNSRAMNVLDFEQLQSAFLEESTDLVNRQRDKYQRLGEIFLENQTNRIRAIDEAYELRRAYVGEAKSSTARSVKSKDSKRKK